MDLSSMLWLIPALPLVGFTINALFGSKLPNPVVAAIAVAGPAVAFVLACLALTSVHEGQGALGTYFTWIQTGGLSVPFGLQADALTAVMLMNVTGVGTLIHLYSYGYMHEDPDFSRFMSYLNLFLAAMLVLVLGDNLLLLFVGWEGVGLCSFLLIGFSWKELANTDAARKAFVVNRVGDFAFLVGLFSLFSMFGTVRFDGLEAAISGIDLTALVPSGPLKGWTYADGLLLSALCLFGGATGKSAQIPLYVWLPDAMAGPTPVSALIHAATMVTAGVYLIGRMDFLFVLLPDVGTVVAVVAAATALLSGLIAMAQTDIKKVLAYSTVSQLGFMFAGMATTLWVSGIFHVLTHAFFKALLFLGAGAVIHALHGEQDMRKMGGLRKDLGIVFWPFLVGSLALAGVPGLAGFFSKDLILRNVYLVSEHQGGVWGAVFWSLVFTAALTAFYTTRMVALTFFGAPFVAPDHGHAAHGHGGHDDHGHGGHDDHDDHGHGGHGRHLHMPHWTMTVVLMTLAVLAAFGGFALGGESVGEPLIAFLEPMWSVAPWVSALDHEALHHAHEVALMASTVAVVAGIGAGVALYGPLRGTLDALVAGPLALGRKVAEDKFYVDEIYAFLVVRPIGAAAQVLFKVVDRLLIDGLLVEGSGKAVLGFGRVLRLTQPGAVSASTGATLLGTVAVLAWVVLHG